MKKIKYLKGIMILVILIIMLSSIVISVELSSEESTNIPNNNLQLRTQLLELDNSKLELSEKGLGANRINDLIVEGFLYYNNEHNQ